MVDGSLWLVAHPRWGAEPAGFGMDGEETVVEYAGGHLCGPDCALTMLFND